MRNVFDDEERQGDDHWQSNPHFERRHLRAIELALRQAWSELLQDHKTAVLLSGKGEVLISHLLREQLDDIRNRSRRGVPGYTCLIFERPHVGAEIQTLEGKIRKPDIVLGLSGKRRPGVSKSFTDSIFVECKIIEQGKKNVGLYCREGLERFVSGAYAQWMREGMMVAYVRASQVLPHALSESTETPQMRALLASDGKLRRCTLTRIEPYVYITTHERKWPYPDDRGFPGPIAIRHLWLHV